MERNGEKMGFAGKTILITGAAGTLGRAIAQRFYQEGACLALVDLDAEKLERAAAEEGFTERTLLLPADVTVEEQVAGYVEQCREHFGKIDVFFNNAGITGARSRIADMELQHFRKLMEVNVSGILLGMKYVLRVMYEQENGCIINTASHKGKMCVAGSGDYAASKSAVIMLTKVAALESAEHHVRVNCILPGIVRSPMIFENQKKKNPALTEAEIEGSFAKSIPMKRMCRPEEVADAVHFLASEEAAYMTGTELHLDGGTTAVSL